jgi:tetratricopeptide (TPR) repeat protein
MKEKCLVNNKRLENIRKKFEELKVKGGLIKYLMTKKMKKNNSAEKERLEKIKQELEELKKKPKRYLTAIADAYRSLCQYRRAIAYYKRATARVLSYSRTLKEIPEGLVLDIYRRYSSLGDCYFELREYRNSIYYFKKALKMKYRYSPHYDYMGLAYNYRALGKKKIAKKYSKLAIKYARKSREDVNSRFFILHERLFNRDLFDKKDRLTKEEFDRELKWIERATKKNEARNKARAKKLHYNPKNIAI